MNFNARQVILIDGLVGGQIFTVPFLRDGDT